MNGSMSCEWLHQKLMRVASAFEFSLPLLCFVSHLLHAVTASYQTCIVPDLLCPDLLPSICPLFCFVPLGLSRVASSLTMSFLYDQVFLSHFVSSSSLIIINLLFSEHHLKARASPLPCSLLVSSTHPLPPWFFCIHNFLCT